MATNGDVMDVGLAHQGELDSFRLRLGFWLWLLTHYDQIDDRKDAEVTFYPCITIQHYRQGYPFCRLKLIKTSQRYKLVVIGRNWF